MGGQSLYQVGGGVAAYRLFYPGHGMRRHVFNLPRRPQSAVQTQSKYEFKSPSDSDIPMFILILGPLNYQHQRNIKFNIDIIIIIYHIKGLDFCRRWD